jgi:pyruvate dehydrogenase E1 component alpha subunit
MFEARTHNPTNLTQAQLLEAMHKMMLIRRVEEVAGRAYQQQLFSGFCHLYIGQEAVAVAATAAMQPDDAMIVAYRDHGQAIAKGVGSYEVMAELLAKRTGTTGGRGGSMHIFDAPKGFLGGWGIVGGQIPLAAGVAWAFKYRNEKRVCLCSFGEGSIHQGVFHEALNMASLWNLPAVFMCENNHYAMGTAMERISPVADLQVKADSYAMDRAQINGQDFFTAYEGLKLAIDRAREQSRPTFLDIKTYRFRGHSMSDPGKYRSREEVEQEKARDPILRLRADLVGMGYATEPQLDAMDEACTAAAKDALERARQDNLPDPNTLWDYLYA